MVKTDCRRSVQPTVLTQKNEKGKKANNKDEWSFGREKGERGRGSTDLVSHDIRFIS